MPSKKNHASNTTIRFVLDGEIKTIQDIAPTTTVLNYLREELRRTGTKEGCAEGDCGACTVVLAELNGNGVRFRAINSCIQFMPTLDGKELITVESLKGADGNLHPVQQAMVDCHGSQCGFCTPGFVMSLFALYKSEQQPSRPQIRDALAGNLCRCTGYRPIIEAAEKMYHIGDNGEDKDQTWMSCSFSSAGDRQPAPGERDMIERLQAIQRTDTLAMHGEQSYFAPAKLADLATLVRRYPQAYILAGGTDIGLWVTKQHKDLDTVIYIGNVKELKRLLVTDTHIEVGAGVTLSDACADIARYYPDLGELFRRFASPPIRNAGTLGGNIANGSPIGDSMPALIALGSTLILRRGKKTRELPLDEYYLAYQKTARTEGEFVEAVRIPLPQAQQQFRTYKISKRFDQDISAVCGAYSMTLEDGQVRAIRICYGGMAATPKRALACEQALTSQDWSEATVIQAMTKLEQDYTPITDMRAGSDYRRRVAQNLLLKFFQETSADQIQTRVIDYGRSIS